MKKEKGNKTGRDARRILGIIMSAVFVVSVLTLKWMVFMGKRYTLPLFLKAVHVSGGLPEYFSQMTKTALETVTSEREYVEFLPSYFLLYVILAAAVLSVLRIVLLILHKNVRFLKIMIYGMVLAVFLVLLTFGGYVPDVGLIASVIAVGIDCLGGRYLEERQQIRRDAEALKKEETEQKKEKKQRKYFPGRYDRGFYHVVWKNFIYNRKSYFLFILGAGGVVTILHTLLGVQSALKSGGAGIGTGYENGMQRILEEIFPVSACFSVLILSLIITHYLRTRMHNYSIFNSLGIRKNTLRLIIGIEYAVCLLLSLAAGLILSGGLLFLAKRTVFANIAQSGWSVGWPKTALVTGGIYTAAVIVSSLVNYHLFEHKSLLQISTRRQEPEKLPRRFIIPGIIAGLAVMAAAVARYWLPPNTERFSANIWMLAGSFILFYFLFARITAVRSRQGESRGETLLSVLPWRYRFKTNYRFWYLLFAFHLLAGMIYIPEFAAAQAAGDTDALYPYDFVCMSYEEDEDFFSNLSDTYDVDIQTLPMLRVTTPLGAPYTWKQAAANQYMSVLWPQGQHIAVPEKSYRELKEAAGEEPGSLKLKEKEIHVVFQQDTSVKSHPLEWYIGDKEPRLRIGQPIRNYIFMEREMLFPEYDMKSSERSILTGMFQQGRQENIVVFSDEVFDGLYHNGTGNEGPTRLKLIKCGEENYGKIERELGTFAERHKNDAAWDDRIQPYYAKRTSAAETDAEHYFKKTACLAVLAGLLTGSFFIFFIKYGLEKEELVRKFSQLKCVGMAKKRRVGLLKGEMAKIIWGSYLSAMILSLPFVCAAAKLRMFKAGETAAYLKYAGLSLLCYTVVYGAVMMALGSWYIRTVLKDTNK